MLNSKLWAAVLLSLFISGCATSTKKPNQEQQRMIDTAKINAQLGIAYLEQNNVVRSRHKLLKAMSQAPEIPEVWYSMGYFLESTGSKHEARTHYKKALELDPTRGDSLNNYGTFLCRSGEYQAAIDQFLLAVSDNNYLDPADAYENAGLCALKLPDNEQAEIYFKHALIEDSARPVSVIKLAAIYFQRNDLKLAKSHVERFLSLSPPTNDSRRLQKMIASKETINAAPIQKILPKKVMAQVTKKPAKRIAKLKYTKTAKKKTKLKKKLAKKKVYKKKIHAKKLSKKHLAKKAKTKKHIASKKPFKPHVKQFKPRVKMHAARKTITKKHSKKKRLEQAAKSTKNKQHAKKVKGLSIDPGKKTKTLQQHDILVENNTFERSMQIA